jgi:zinc transporter, ZIP family
VLDAFVYGLLASSGLLVGGVIGLTLSPPRRVMAAVMAFGAGVLVSALTFDLMTEAFEGDGSPAAVVIGFLLGALIYVLFDQLLDRLAAQSPKREGRHPQDVERSARGSESQGAVAISGMALLVGAIIDGIPENAALGVSLLASDSSLGVVLLAAIFLANVPESISGAVGMRAEGRSRGYVFTVWAVATAGCTLAAVVGYAVLGGASDHLIAAILALAAGGILAMLADTMMPEAFENGGPFVAMATAVGFLLAALLTQLTGP